MKGSLVIARCYEGLPAVLRIWDLGRKVIYLSEESQFQRLMSGMEAMLPIGFPPEDVFAYDPSFAENVSTRSVDWNLLRTFSALSRQCDSNKPPSVVSSE